MTSDTYLLITCKHSPSRRIEIGKETKHHITQWRCACGKNVALSDLQVWYVADLQALLSEREFLGTLSDEQEAAMTGQLNKLRDKMSKTEQDQLEVIIKAVVDSCSTKKVQAT